MSGKSLLSRELDRTRRAMTDAGVDRLVLAGARLRSALSSRLIVIMEVLETFVG